LQQYNLSRIPKTISTSYISLLKSFADSIGVPVITNVQDRADVEILNSSLTLPFIVIDESLKNRKLFSRFYLRNCLIASFTQPSSELDLSVENCNLLLNVIIDYLYKGKGENGKIKLKNIIKFLKGELPFEELKFEIIMS
jgi:hypothetical protein